MWGQGTAERAAPAGWGSVRDSAGSLAKLQGLWSSPALTPGPPAHLGPGPLGPTRLTLAPPTCPRFIPALLTLLQILDIKTCMHVAKRTQ